MFKITAGIDKSISVKILLQYKFILNTPDPFCPHFSHLINYSATFCQANKKGEQQFVSNKSQDEQYKCQRKNERPREVKNGENRSRSKIRHIKFPPPTKKGK